MRRLLIASISALAVATLAAPVLAQPVSPPVAPAPAPAPAMTPLVLKGVVTAVDASSLTLKDDKGAAVTVPLTDKVRMIRVRKIELDAIQPGSFVATANVNQPDGSGVSTELRVFGPSLKGLGEGSGPMQDGQNMTNGTVKVVVGTPKGREMDVGYTDKKTGPGVRHITVPPGMVIYAWDLAEPGALKPGAMVEVRGGQTADGTMVIRGILIGDAG
jgi:hypothetical protein